MILPQSSWRSVFLCLEFVFLFIDFWDGRQFVIVICSFDHFIVYNICLLAMRSKEGSCFVLLISFPNYRHRNTPDGGRQTNDPLMKHFTFLLKLEKSIHWIMKYLFLRIFAIPKKRNSFHVFIILFHLLFLYFYVRKARCNMYKSMINGNMHKIKDMYLIDPHFSFLLYIV